jgi:hypothetical protein
MSKFKGLIQEARKPARQKEVKKGNKLKIEEKEVSLTIKIPVSVRRHWVSCAKAEGTSIKDEVVKALSERFPK